MEYTLDISFLPLPSTVTKVGELIASGDPDPAPLAKIVKRDSMISINVLRRVNSAYYGVRRSVESVRQAVHLLGFTEVSTIVLIEGMSTMQSRFPLRSRSAFQNILQSAVFTGRFAQKLTERLEVSWNWTRPSFSSGLLYAAARLVLLHDSPTKYATLAEDSDGALPSAADEKRELGQSHETLAPRLCAHWNLPSRICSILCAAPDPDAVSDGPLSILARAVWIGSHLSVQDLANRDLTVPERAYALGGNDIDTLVLDVASDASAYAVEVGCI